MPCGNFGSSSSVELLVDIFELGIEIQMGPGCVGAKRGNEYLDWVGKGGGT